MLGPLLCVATQVAASYLQRINDNWSGGGEGFYSHENLTTWCNNAQSVIGGGRTRPFAYSMALSYAADLTKVRRATRARCSAC